MSERKLSETQTAEAVKLSELLYWRNIDKEKPKPNQVVLVKAYPKNPIITLAYVVRYKRKLEFGVANSSEFERKKALESFPISDAVFEWMPLPPV